MVKSTVKSRAEQQFAASQKKDKKVLKEREKARQDQADKMAKLRSLRLAKEAEDKAAAELAAQQVAAKKAASKKKKAPELPQTHRRQS